MMYSSPVQKSSLTTEVIVLRTYSIHLWAVCWQLHLIPSEYEALLISKKRSALKTSYVLGESFIPWKPVVRYLGVFVNSVLS